MITKLIMACHRGSETMLRMNVKPEVTMAQKISSPGSLQESKMNLLLTYTMIVNEETAPN
jgi:hypothetical protein